MDMAGTGGPTSRSEVCAAAVMEASRLFANCDPDFNSGDRGECGGFQRPECANRAPIECFRPATALQCRAQATWLVYAVLSRLSRLRHQDPNFQRLAGYDTFSAALATRQTVTKNFGYLASGNYFDMLGVQPLLGRFFHANDEHGTDSAPYIVLSYDFWRARCNSDGTIVGTTVSVNKQPLTVIGIAPQDFHGTEIFYWPKFWTPITNGPLIGYSHHYLDNRSTHNPFVLGKLKAGGTPQQASDDLNSICRQLAEQYPIADYGLDARLVKPGLMGDLWGDAARNFLFGVMALALLVLLAACANLGSIFAARAADRSRELAIRLAIGSSRWVDR